MGNYTQPEFTLTVAEEDLPTYMRVYRTLKDSFSAESRMVILHVEEDIYEFRLIGLLSRDVLEFCANVFAELPSETVKLVEVPEEVAEDLKSIHDNFVPPYTSSSEDEEPEAADEAEYEDDDTEEEDEELEEESTNTEGETPAEEIQRKLNKPKIVRKTRNSAVSVEAD